MWKQKSRTTGQERRRQARIARRRAEGHAYAPPVSRPRQRFSFARWRAVRQSALDGVAKLIAAIGRNRALSASQKPRCAYMRVYMEKGVQVAGDPCGGGVLRAYRVSPKAPSVLRCQVCGREYPVAQQIEATV